MASDSTTDYWTMGASEPIPNPDNNPNVAHWNAMAAAAAAAGADGLMVEVHNNPAAALCDGPQSITPDTFEELCRRVEAVRTALAVHDEEARAA